MMARKAGFIVIALAGLMALQSGCAIVDTRPQQVEIPKDAVVNAFLARRDAGEDRQAAGSAVAYLNGGAKPDIVLVWATIGRTYWHSNLTVFSDIMGRYREIDTMQLNGAAKLANIEGRTVVVQQMEYTPSDKICCPSMKRLEKYEFRDGKIVQLPN
jgi:hypothetical protein